MPLIFSILSTNTCHSKEIFLTFTFTSPFSSQHRINQSVSKNKASAGLYKKREFNYSFNMSADLED